MWQSGLCRPSTSFFIPVLGLPVIVEIGAGFYHSAALDINGDLWVWANQRVMSWASFEPCRMEGLPPLHRMACGKDFVVAESSQGLHIVGDFLSGQMVGRKHRSSKSPPIFYPVNELPPAPFRCLASMSSCIVLVDADGNVWNLGTHFFGFLGHSKCWSGFLRIRVLSSVRMVSCGQLHTLALDDLGGVWTWGMGECGQLGTGRSANEYFASPVDSLEGCVSLVAGGYHSLVISPDGGLLAFGHSWFGQLGVQVPLHQFTPVQTNLQAAPSFFNKCRLKSARF